MLNAFMLTSGWLFWIVVFAILVAETAATESDDLFASTAILLTGAVIITLFSDADPFGFVRANPVLTTLAVPVYFIAGAFWALWKWHRVIAASVEAFTKNKAALVKEHQENKAWNDSPFEEYVRRFKGYPPSAADSKERITTWIAFWPFSLFWALMKFPREIATYIYRRIVTVFERMSESAFAGKF